MNLLPVFTKPFDVDAFCSSWKDAPVFCGERKGTLRVQEWLKKIEARCREHKVHERHWHHVGQRYMDPHALEKLAGVEKVMKNVRGTSFKFDWKKFKAAMESMNCR